MGQDLESRAGAGRHGTYVPLPTDPVHADGRASPPMNPISRNNTPGLQAGQKLREAGAVTHTCLLAHLLSTGCTPSTALGTVRAARRGRRVWDGE